MAALTLPFRGQHSTVGNRPFAPRCVQREPYTLPICRWLELWRDLREVQGSGAFALLTKENMLAQLCCALLRGGHLKLARSFLQVPPLKPIRTQVLIGTNYHRYVYKDYEYSTDYTLYCLLVDLCYSTEETALLLPQPLHHRFLRPAALLLATRVLRWGESV